MFSFTRLLKSFGYAWEGLWFAISHNQNLRIHIVAAAIVVLLSIYFDITPFEMGILGVLILLVMCTEMINSVIEEMVDLIITQHHQQAKIAKDVAAGMVLLSAMGAVVVGILIFLPHIFKLIGFHH